MKRISFLVLVALIAFAFSTVNAGLELNVVAGSAGPGLLATGTAIEIEVTWNATTEVPHGFTTGCSNGYRLYSVPASSVTFTASGDWNTAPIADIHFEATNIFVNQFTGGGEDTLGFGGFRLFLLGIPEIFNDSLVYQKR